MKTKYTKWLAKMASKSSYIAEFYEPLAADIEEFADALSDGRIILTDGQTNDFAEIYETYLGETA
jgi:hypothetical protein